MAMWVGGRLQVKAIPAARNKNPNVVRKEAVDGCGDPARHSLTLASWGVQPPPGSALCLGPGSPACSVLSSLPRPHGPAAALSVPLAPPCHTFLSGVDLRARLHLDNASMCWKVDCRQNKVTASVKHTF